MALMTLHQYNIHIIVSRKNVSFDNIYILFSPEVESAQLHVVLKLDIAQFVHMI